MKFDSSYLDILPEIKSALKENKPIVALESTIISHGMPFPKNVETAKKVEDNVRENGAIPATIAIVGGRLKVGLTVEELDYFGKTGLDVVKASRRDIPFLVAEEKDGATTVAATMIIASMAGIKLFATGGIGGVHRDGQNSMDISADLEELAKTNVSVICAGIKSILDIGRTLEYLETVGVPVVGYNTDRVPAFYARDSGFDVDYRCDDPMQIAKAIYAKYRLGLNGGVLITNPVPEKHALDYDEIENTITDAIKDMDEQGITGKDTTPFLLARIAEKTAGVSLESNIELVLNNAALAAKIAVAHCELS